MRKNNSFAQSLSHALSGLIILLKYERNSRFHLLATALVILVSILVHISLIEWTLIILVIFSVWIAEAFNTSLEQVFDVVEPRENKLVKAGKDISAGAVLLTAILSVIVGIIILGPPIIEILLSFLQNYK